MDAIVSATRIGAMTIGKSREMGTIEPGKLANFVFVSGNPLDDIANLRSVTMTVSADSSTAAPPTGRSPKTKRRVNSERACAMMREIPLRRTT